MRLPLVDEQTVTDSESKVNIKFEEDLKLQRIKEELVKSFAMYRKTLNFMAADAPMGVLCLPKSTETILAREGLHRVYDLFDRDLTEIKGLGAVRIGDLTSRLDKFFTMG